MHTGQIVCAKTKLTLDVEIFVIIIKYMSLKDIFLYMLCLNKQIRELILTENYLLFKKFIKHFSILKKFKHTDMPAYVDVL